LLQAPEARNISQEEIKLKETNTRKLKRESIKTFIAAVLSIVFSGGFGIRTHRNKVHLIDRLAKLFALP
jgi:hypothetical protein